MGRPVSRQLLRNALLDLTTIMSATAYHRRSYTERYSRFSGGGGNERWGRRWRSVLLVQQTWMLL
jgi:hypothetical protein